MKIDIVDGKHSYDFEYTLAGVGGESDQQEIKE
jgi:hypothetical protein